MENKNLEEVIALGKKQSSMATIFDVLITKLLTAFTIMPSIGIDYNFLIDDDKVAIELTSNSQTQNFRQEQIGIYSYLYGTIQLLTVINHVYNYMNNNDLLNKETELSPIDHILWTALENTAMASSRSGYAKQIILKNIEEKSLELETFRRIIAQTNVHGKDHSNVILSTLLMTLNYYSNGKDNQFGKMSINEKTFFQGLSDIKSLNKAAFSILNRELQDIGLFTSRSENDYLKASNLVNEYLEAFNANKKISTKDIDVFNAIDTSQEFMV